MHWFCNVASNSPSPVSLAQISSGSGRMLVVRDAPNTSPNSGATGRFTASLAAHLETEFTHAVTGQPLTGTLTSAPNSNTKHFMGQFKLKIMKSQGEIGCPWQDVLWCSCCIHLQYGWHMMAQWQGLARAALACAACFRRLRRATASVLQHQAECRRQVTTQSFIQRTMAPWSGGLELASWFKPSVIQVLRKFQPY